MLGLRPLGGPCLGESRRFRPLARRDGFRPRRDGTAVRRGQALALESERDSQGLGPLEGEALLETELSVRGRPEVAAVGHLPARHCFAERRGGTGRARRRVAEACAGGRCRSPTARAPSLRSADVAAARHGGVVRTALHARRPLCRGF